MSIATEGNGDSETGDHGTDQAVGVGRAWHVVIAGFAFISLVVLSLAARWCSKKVQLSKAAGLCCFRRSVSKTYRRKFQPHGAIVSCRRHVVRQQSETTSRGDAAG